MINKILIGLLLINFTNAYSQTLTKDQVKEYGLKMLISEDYSLDVIKLSEPVKNLQIALLNIPYREFPSILIFKYDNQIKKWIRVFEGLCPGIQDNPSGLVDWHVLGTGIDFILDNKARFSLQNTKVKIMIDAMNKENGILIPYQNFLHMHTADSASNKTFEPYTIDKSQYYDFSLKLFDKRYTGYPKEECIMFDTPRVIDIKLEFVDNYFRITSLTENGQEWIYSFKDIDENNKYLVDKKINVIKLQDK